MENLNFAAALPEIVLLIAVVLVLLIDVIAHRKSTGTAADRLALLALLAPNWVQAQVPGPVVLRQPSRRRAGAQDRTHGSAARSAPDRVAGQDAG